MSKVYAYRCPYCKRVYNYYPWAGMCLICNIKMERIEQDETEIAYREAHKNA